MDPFLYYLLTALVASGGAFVQRTTGFGLGIFVMLFFPYMMPETAAAAAVSGLLSCVISSYNAVLHRRALRLRLALPLLLSAAVTIPLAVRFSSVAPASLMKLVLGVILIAFSLWFLFLGKHVRLRPTAVNGLVAGGLGGVLSGLFSTGGPPVVLYLIHATEDKTVYFATIQAYFAITNLYSALFRAINGVITPFVLTSVAVGLIGCFVGNAIGSLVFRRINPETLRKIVYVGMIVSGLLMILRR